MIFKSSVTGRTSKNKEKNSAREAFASGYYALSLTNNNEYSPGGIKMVEIRNIED